ncbi:MAG: hypothetical protein J6N47_02485 [Lachnospiraceae bacterium]|nr:hypothetical protein [Lachnospiraceae bacterium]
MYISSKKHILSNAIMSTAVVKILATLLEGGLRLLFKSNPSISPDMLDGMLWYSQLAVSFLQIVMIALIFFLTYKRLLYYVNLIDKEDRTELGDLQREFLGENLASLSVSSISRLLQLWAVIFVGAELIYTFTSIMYRRFIEILLGSMNLDSLNNGSFVMMYNMTHGFKYLEILSAILLGVVMTGIFLNDRLLKISSIGILSIFLACFAVLQMQTVFFMGREVGIVWTSIIFHATETIGLLVLALYLSKKYKGM